MFRHTSRVGSSGPLGHTRCPRRLQRFASGGALNFDFPCPRGEVHSQDSSRINLAMEKRLAVLPLILGRDSTFRATHVERPADPLPRS